jgi:hemerythrin
MTTFEWSELYATGIPRVDREHRELFQCVKSFNEACRENRGPDQVEQTLHYLHHYAMTHFKGEEDQMARVAYPELEGHRLEHESLLSRVRKTLEKLHEGESPDPEKFGEFVNAWICQHIIEQDRKFAGWLADKTKRIRRSPSASFALGPESP